MKARDVFSIAGGNLARRKGRTALTLVGVVIGVAALVLMVSLGIGLKLQFLKSFQSEEVLRTVTVTREDRAKRNKKGFEALLPTGKLIPISKEEIETIAKLDGVEEAYPEVDLTLPCTFPLRRPKDGHSSLSEGFIPVTGIPPSTAKRFAKYVKRGRMWKPGEIGCLLPSRLVEARLGLAPDDLALDQPLLLNVEEDKKDEPWKRIPILGILDSEHLGLMGQRVYVPLEHALFLRDRLRIGDFGAYPYVKDKFRMVQVKAKSPKEVGGLKARLKNMGYSVITAGDVIETINTTFLIVEAFMGCIGAIGLLVALFGIANTMAMSVLERTREIGIMKALGARNRDIRRLFLLEAAWIGLVGGVIGLAGGWISGLGMNALARGLLDLPPHARLFHVSLWLAAGSLLFAVAVAVVGGLIPAVRAARLDPVEALRFQ